MSLPAKFDNLKNTDPAFYASLDAFKELALGPGVLETKTKFLIGAAFHLGLNRTEQAKCALTQAREAGATESEVDETLRMVYFLLGMPTAAVIAELLKV